MTLIDLLEQGKKATCKDCEVKYICVVDGLMYTSNGFEFAPILKDLTSNDWVEYEEYETNFEFSNNKEKYYFISSIGIIDKITPYGSMDCNFLKVFNAFPNKELAEYIHKKQLLERKLMIFSYLNGANEIDWSNEKTKWLINCYMYHNEFRIMPTYRSECKYLNEVYFSSDKICKKAIELYKDEIKEVMEMSLKFGF